MKELANKKNVDLQDHKQKLNDYEKKVHELRKDKTVVVGEIDEWKARHEEVLTKVQMVKILCEAMKVMWNEVVTNSIVINNHLQLFLVFDLIYHEVK